MNNSWLDQVGGTQIPTVAQKIGLTSGRGKSWGPCPRCGKSERGSSDERLALGMTSDGKGWACHAGCAAEGDLADLLSYRMFGHRLREVDADQRAEVRREAGQLGLWTDNNPHDLTDPASMIRKKSPADQKSDKTLNAPAEPNDVIAKVFSWREEMPQKAFELLWHDPDAAPVLDYLRNVRQIPEDVIRAWGLGAYVLRRAGKVVARYVVIPLCDERGKPVNMKFRSVPGPCLVCSPDGVSNGKGCKHCKDSKEGIGTTPKIYRACAGRPLPLYGAERLKPGPVIVVEGELDVVAMSAYGWSNVVSGTAGAGQDWPDDWLDRLESHPHFTICFDNDKAGDEGTAKLAAKLGKYRCSRARLPCKDAGDCLITGVPDVAVRAALDASVSMVGIDLVTPDYFAAQIETLINNPAQLIGMQSSLQVINEALGGLTPGVHIFSGETGQGKTSFATFLLWDLAGLGNPVLLTSFEQQPIGTSMKLLRMEVEGDFTKRTAAERIAGLQRLRAKNVIIANKYGDVSDQEIIDTVRYARRRRGARVALIDHLDFVVRTRRKGEDEREAKERVIRTLATIGVEDDIAIILIVHPNNQANNQQRRVGMGDLKGASAIRQDAHSVTIVELLPATNSRPFPASCLYFDKVRSEFGTGAGTQRILAYDPLSCWYASRWEDTPSGKAGITVALAH